MKKLFMLIAAACTGFLGLQAQDVQIATLQTGENTSLFYGVDAFKQAMEAAEHGSTITLSSGTFNSADITKAVRIYGAGYEVDSLLTETEQGSGVRKYPTRLYGEFAIAVDSVGGLPSEGFYMEGIYTNHNIAVANLDGATFSKCSIQSKITFTTSKDVFWTQCRIRRVDGGLARNMTFTNCIIFALGVCDGNSNMYVSHCTLLGVAQHVFATIEQSVIVATCWDTFSGGSMALDPKNTLRHNLVKKPGSEIEGCIGIETNWYETLDYSDIFKNPEIEWNYYDDDETYELSDAAKAKYIGPDGTEVGAYGGDTPLNSTPTIPYVVKKDIATKTVDGKLKVNITVAVSEEAL